MPVKWSLRCRSVADSQVDGEYGYKAITPSGVLTLSSRSQHDISRHATHATLRCLRKYETTWDDASGLEISWVSDCGVLFEPRAETDCLVLGRMSSLPLHFT